MQSRYARKHGRDVEYTRDSVECVMSSVCASAHVLMCAHSICLCGVHSSQRVQGVRVCRMGERIFVPVSRRIECGRERSLPERKSES
jgi:hypothetical protein